MERPAAASLLVAAIVALAAAAPQAAASEAPLEAPSEAPSGAASADASLAPAADRSGARPLSPLLRLYEAPNASVDVTLRAAPRPARRAARPAAEPLAPPSATITVPYAPQAGGRARPPRFTRPAPRSRADRYVARADGRTPRGYAYAGTIYGVARAYDIDPALLGAVVRRESGMNPAARSPKGAVGMMQLMPGTAARFGLGGRRLAEPAANLAAGASYLKALQRRYGSNLPLILAAYNAGEGAVDRHGRRIPPYKETQGYVSGILGDYGAALRRRLSAH